MAATQPPSHASTLDLFSDAADALTPSSTVTLAPPNVIAQMSPSVIGSDEGPESTLS